MNFDSDITNPFLRTHLRYVEQTEPPKIFHLWSAIVCASACLGRHVWLDVGIGELYANMYVLLVGPPGARKGTAMKFPVRLMRDLNVRFAPDDTAGQRKGLILAISGEEDEEGEGTKTNGEIKMDAGLVTMEDLENVHLTVNGVDSHTMFIYASEWGSFMGQNNLDLTRFLCKMWDGEPYQYKISGIKHVLKDPLVTMAGCTTPTDLSMILPPAAMGQGFMSRIVLVHAHKKAKQIARPNLNRECEEPLRSIYEWLVNDMKGAMYESTEAYTTIDNIYYGEPVKINDNRFVYYMDRRHTHLQKLAMILAACRRSYVVEVEDIQQAHMILQHTEQTMSDALGEYGLSPVATARQKMLEFIQGANTPVPQQLLWMVMRNDMKLSDMHTGLTALENAGKITTVSTKHGPAFIYNDDYGQAMKSLIAEV